MALATTLSVGFDFNQSGSADFGPQRFAGKVSKLLQFVSGTAANQADLLFVDERTVASNTADDIDVAGVLVSAFGTTITAAEIVAVLVINGPIDPTDAANTTNLTLGGDANAVPNITSGPIAPGGFVFLASPGAAGLATVTASTGDIIQVANSSGAAATYQIAILARSA